MGGRYCGRAAEESARITNKVAFEAMAMAKPCGCNRTLRRRGYRRDRVSQILLIADIC